VVETWAKEYLIFSEHLSIVHATRRARAYIKLIFEDLPAVLPKVRFNFHTEGKRVGVVFSGNFYQYLQKKKLFKKKKETRCVKSIEEKPGFGRKSEM
jgi:hypothetical protein